MKPVSVDKRIERRGGARNFKASGHTETAYVIEVVHLNEYGGVISIQFARDNLGRIINTRTEDTAIAVIQKSDHQPRVEYRVAYAEIRTRPFPTWKGES